MNSTSREIRRLKSRFLIGVVFGVVTVAAAFCYSGSERLPAVSTICLFGCLARVWTFVWHLSKHFSAVHSIVIVWEGYIRLLFKRPLKFRNELETTYREPKLLFLLIKIPNKNSLQSWRFYFASKRNEMKQTDPQRKHSLNARKISTKELGTMSKNNLRGITLVRRPIWGIHSLTLIMSCYNLCLRWPKLVFTVEHSFT